MADYISRLRKWGLEPNQDVWFYDHGTPYRIVINYYGNMFEKKGINLENIAKDCWKFIEETKPKIVYEPCPQTYREQLETICTENNLILEFEIYQDLSTKRSSCEVIISKNNNRVFTYCRSRSYNYRTKKKAIEEISKATILFSGFKSIYKDL